MKNITLALSAMVLASCLVLLLFLATHQNALVKVHEKISSYSGVESVGLCACFDLSLASTTLSTPE